MATKFMKLPVLHMLHMATKLLRHEIDKNYKGVKNEY